MELDASFYISDKKEAADYEKVLHEHDMNLVRENLFIEKMLRKYPSIQSFRFDIQNYLTEDELKEYNEIAKKIAAFDMPVMPGKPAFHMVKYQPLHDFISRNFAKNGMDNNVNIYLDKDDILKIVAALEDGTIEPNYLFDVEDIEETINFLKFDAIEKLEDPNKVLYYNAWYTYVY